MEELSRARIRMKIYKSFAFLTFFCTFAAEKETIRNMKQKVFISVMALSLLATAHAWGQTTVIKRTKTETENRAEAEKQRQRVAERARHEKEEAERVRRRQIVYIYSGEPVTNICF